LECGGPPPLFAEEEEAEDETASAALILSFQLWILGSYSTAVPVLGYIVTAVAAYLLGSIPTGFLVAKARGIDIRTAGSGNIGATNAFRILGIVPGALVLLADACKGWLAVQIGAPVVAQLFPGAPVDYLRIAASIAVILGHNYTCWLRFKGGKGIATSAGALVALVPWALLTIMIVWLVLFLLTRYVSIASMGASFSLPFATWFTAGHHLGLTAVTAVMGVLAICRHRRNIQRLLEGKESRVEFRKKEVTQ
jgi:glycerol-3-phosphate acyltransferase PlsY